jgi:SnoaL-like domain
MTDKLECFELLMQAWNEHDPGKRRALLDASVASDIAFTDPQYAVKGIDAFDQMMADFQARMPNAKCVRTSEIDHHHNRVRYHWSVIIDENTKVDGFDASSINDEGKVDRVDGFFGPVTML